ncbi:MAG: aldo/keto reductase [Caldilineaceae bacterium SB0670_bin_27]|uniref:Aldo/keto reductase n=1 Tax=Caldilineaceae bacterium SB0664_bin_27 TaxID=2605260 RepID=A0A6B0YT79_9CHLR|nr:aldo/keto reductase [Caldilineaceae bacterium SB0664_bin_27]MYJ78323.1 aldo/keto reductase [Caldilineaceae bacterium SB0670_bin_27]
MEYRTFGRTGLRVSVAGIGAGGPSKLGIATGRSEEESIAVVRRALELGVNYIDTAQAYGTEEIVGKSIQDFDRDSLVIATKKGAYRDGEPVPADEFAAGVEASLKRLGVETIDVFHFHGARMEQYRHICEELVPVLQSMRQAGKIRHLAVSEHFASDFEHRLLRQAIEDDLFDVVMVGFNILNQTARRDVFPGTQEKGIATECMFAVRRAFSRPERLREILVELRRSGEIDVDAVDLFEPLEWVMELSDAKTLPEAAYRFCRHEPGIDLVLTGTGNIRHLEENIASLLRPPLPAEVVERLRHIFGRVHSVNGS